MDKNIAAMLRENTFTIEVLFYADRNNGQLGDRSYTYVTMDKSIKIDDHVVVLVCGIPKVVKVVVVHEDLQIHPNDDKLYQWVVSKLDMEPYNELLKANDEITRLISKSYRKNSRKQMQTILLAETGVEEQARLMEILK